MAMTNAERQARYKERLQRSAYENEVRDAQIKQLEMAVNEVRAKVGMAEIQLAKPAAPHPK